MELTEAMRTTGTCRYFRPDPVPDDVLLHGVRRRALRPAGRQPAAGALDRGAGRGHQAGARRPLPAAVEGLPRRHRHRRRQRRRAAPSRDQDADYFAEHFASVPGDRRRCARSSPGCTPPTPSWAGSSSSAAGRSTRPCRTSCLALRDQGVGSAFTTLLCLERAEGARAAGRSRRASSPRATSRSATRSGLPDEADALAGRGDRLRSSRSAPRCSLSQLQSRMTAAPGAATSSDPSVSATERRWAGDARRPAAPPRRAPSRARPLS